MLKEEKMNKLELLGFINLINEIKESEKIITISEFFDNCINKAEEINIINAKWFMEFKYQVEEELKKYADEHFYSRNRILKGNRVERTERGLIVLLGKEIKYKDKILEIFFLQNLIVILYYGEAFINKCPKIMGNIRLFYIKNS